MVSSFEDLSNEGSEINPNLSLAEDLIKYKDILGDTLVNHESMTLAELKDCENLNPFKNWFIKVIEQANELRASVSDSFLHEIEQLTKDQVRLAEVMQKNNDLEQKNEELQNDLLEANDALAESGDSSSNSSQSF